MTATLTGFSRPKVILFGEYGADSDEMLSLILASLYHKLGFIELLGVIGNQVPAAARAQTAKQALVSLGLGFVPVGIGEDGYSSSTPEFERDAAFLAPITQVESSRHLLRRLLGRSPDQSVVLVLNSGFTDAVWLWQEDPALFRTKVSRVALMSLTETDGDHPCLDAAGRLLPANGSGGAANNALDAEAASYLYAVLQAKGVPMTITTRHAAYAADLEFNLFEDLADTDHPLGAQLAANEARLFQALWEKVTAPVGSAVRGLMPPDRDPQWFGERFCGGFVPPPGDPNVARYVQRIAIHDAINVMAAIPPLAQQHFRPFKLSVPSEVGPVVHEIIGVSPAVHGIRRPDALRKLLRTGLISALDHAGETLPWPIEEARFDRVESDIEPAAEDGWDAARCRGVPYTFKFPRCFREADLEELVKTESDRLGRPVYLANIVELLHFAVLGWNGYERVASLGSYIDTVIAWRNPAEECRLHPVLRNDRLSRCIEMAEVDWWNSGGTSVLLVAETQPGEPEYNVWLGKSELLAA